MEEWTQQDQAAWDTLHPVYGAGAAPATATAPTININSVATNPGANQKRLESFGVKSGETSANYPQAYQALQTAAQQAGKQMSLAERTGADVAGANPKGAGAVGIFDANTPAFMPDTVDTIADIDNLNANNFVAALNALKASSPTGSTGLGQVSNIEGDKVQKANFNFDRSQSERRFGKTTEDYRNQLRSSLDNTVRAFNDTYGTKYTSEDLLKQYNPSPDEVKAQIRQKYGLDK